MRAASHHPACLFAASVCAGLPLPALEPESYVVADYVSYTAWDAGERPMNALWTSQSGAAPTVLAPPLRLDAGDDLTALRRAPDAGFVFTYRRPLAPGSLTYTVLSSTDLISWTAPALPPDAISSAPNADGRTETVSVRLPAPSASAPLFVRLRVDAASIADSYFTLNNGLAWLPLSRPLNTDFELSLDASHAAFERFLWAGLFNANGTQGYALFWDSATPGQSASAGHISIRKFDVTAPLAFSTGGIPLGESVASGHNPGNPTDAATALPFAKLRLVWGRDAGVLKLYVNGALRQTVYDPDFISFFRLYVSGNGGAKFDNIEVTVPAGAAVPFTTREAEHALNATNGSVVAMTALPSASTSTPELEASGRAFVELSATGHQLTLPNVPAATALVLRHCLPDAPSGGGATATLNLYVNGVFRQTLTLGSKHNWLYGTIGTDLLNSPASGVPYVFWDETAFLVTGGLKAGDTLKLQKDAANTAGFYRIDLLDFETVPAPLNPPAAGSYLSVADYGADGSDENDDSAAILACIAAAKSAGKIVWLPAGTYRQTARFTLDGVVLQGAGPWHTRILGMTEGTDWAGTMGFELAGSGARVSDLALDGYAHTRRAFGGKPFTGGPANWSVENVWITHTNVGFWMSGASDGVIRGCRVRNTYADAINLGRGSSNNLVEHNHVRGCGDDGIALLSEVEHAPSADNVVRLNTVRANWWGQNASLDGGSGNVFEWNYLADNARMAGFTINLSGAWPSHAVTGALIRRNLIVRGGGNHAGQRRGAIWTYAAGNPISNVWFQDNYIKDPVFRGIHLTGPRGQQLIFERNRIENPGEDGVVIDVETPGWAVFTDNTVNELPAGRDAFLNHATDVFAASRSENNF